jgi:hypothetical protein
MNEALGRLRRLRPGVELSELEKGARRAQIIPFRLVSSEYPEKSMAQREIELVEHAIDELPEPFRLVFVTRVVEGMNVARARLGCRPGACRDYSDQDSQPRVRSSRSFCELGDRIEWVNEDVLAHTATARNGDFDVRQPPKKTITSVLNKAGTVEYYCRFHPNMKGVLKIAP